MSAIPAGYKRTDGGVIPDDWLEHSLGELIEFEGGSQPDKSVFRSSWKPGYVRLIQIRDYKTDRFETYIPAKLARRFCDEADIMIGRYGPPVFQILRGIEGAYNVALIKAKPVTAINSEYAYYFLKQDKLFGFIEKLSQRSSGQTGVDLKELRQYPLPLPPTDVEQKAIAEALSDADALIESLEQLLAKKRHLKQAAMQELLTGKKRLPGFSGTWEVKRLGEVADIDSDNLGSATSADYAFNYIALEDVDLGSLRSYSEQVFCSAPSRARRRLRAGDILVSTVRPNLQSHLLFDSMEPNWICSTGFSVVRCKTNDAAPGYIFFHFFGHLVTKQIETLLTGSNYPAINGKDVKNLDIPIPKLPEQIAIAAVLSDMNAEIATLETELAKTRAIKQGMMQKLLTGEIRLL